MLMNLKIKFLKQRIKLFKILYFSLHQYSSVTEPEKCRKLKLNTLPHTEYCDNMKYDTTILHVFYSFLQPIFSLASRNLDQAYHSLVTLSTSHL